MVTRRPTSADPATSPSRHEPAGGECTSRLVAVGPGRPSGPIGSYDALMLGLPAEGAAVFPIQRAKVQAPPLRDETLPRERLLDWLAAKIHQRAVFVIAEAGYGKTTLLADFARRSHARTMWYRLDEQDRDPVGFLNYLVAAGREHVPDFAPTTAALLRELGTGGISHETLVATFVRELSGLGPEGAALIVDDYHLVDDVPEVRSIVQALLRDGPERLTLVVLSRRTPRLAVARLRTLGELAELSTEDLRFRTDETERLFRESYRRPLAPDVLDELSRRTEGWAASLQLVRTALRDRSPGEVRAFVRSLSGTQHQLYDYLAEEVVADLEPGLQDFLMRTSILQVVEPGLAGVVACLDEETTRRRMEEGERVGLLGRRGETRWSHRYHPLVQQFLVERLTRAAGRPAVLDLHRTAARFGESRDWRLAIHHWAAAGDGSDVRRVLAGAIPSVMGSGEFALGESYLERFPAPDRTPVFEVLLSRLDFYRNRIDTALDRARWAAEMADSTNRDPALANVMSLEFMRGNLQAAAAFANTLERESQDELYRQLAEGILLGLAASADGPLAETLATLNRMAEVHRARGLAHYLGITLNNIVSVKLAEGDALGASRVADEARAALESSSAGPELAGLLAMQGLALTQLGDVERARAQFEEARQTKHLLGRVEVLITEADSETWYGSAASAEALLDETHGSCVTAELANQWAAARMSLDLRLGHRLAAGNRMVPDWSTRPGERARAYAVAAHAEVVAGVNANPALQRALGQARRQGAGFWERYVKLLAATSQGPTSIDAALADIGKVDTSFISVLAEQIIPHIADLQPSSQLLMQQEAARRRVRWQEALRTFLAHPSALVRLNAGRLLDQVGTLDDVPTLRQLSRSLKGKHAEPSLGRGLARALAPRVFIDDLSMVTMTIGRRRVRGAEIRRKPLALLCFLLTRQGWVATRDQVLEALWPDLEPDDGQNSLNQTLYFLRRVFDPNFDEDVSAPYVRLESDLIWLDQELVESRSSRCRALLQEITTTQSSSALERLVGEYRGRFAIDFAYEDWSTAYRGTLHSAYLEAVERGVRKLLSAGNDGRAMAIARAALEVDPEADQVELSLLRIYRSTGAHAAAAEQYSHYSDVLKREFEEEPPPLDSLECADR